MQQGYYREIKLAMIIITVSNDNSHSPESEPQSANEFIVWN
jgi:hypothetical protein